MNMVFSYRFDGDIWDYEVEYEDIEYALIVVFAKTYGISVEKAREIYADEWIKYEDLKEEFADCLEEFFKADAYNDYLEARFA